MLTSQPLLWGTSPKCQSNTMPELSVATTLLKSGGGTPTAQSTTRFDGHMIVGGIVSITSKTASVLVTDPAELLTTTEYLPRSGHWTLASVKEELVALKIIPLFSTHW